MQKCKSLLWENLLCALWYKISQTLTLGLAYNIVWISPPKRFKTRNRFHFVICTATEAHIRLFVNVQNAKHKSGKMVLESALKFRRIKLVYFWKLAATMIVVGNKLCGPEGFSVELNKHANVLIGFARISDTFKAVSDFV